MAVFIGSVKSWRSVVDPITKKFKIQTDRLFASYARQVKAQGITTTAEHNKLWREKYQLPL